MLQTMEDMWRMVNTANAAIKDLNSTLTRERARSESLLEQIEKLKEDNEWLVKSRKAHSDAATLAQAGITTMTKTIAWLAENQQIIF
jgi:septal ring factor EnvC (AmiA/AmiB activator)